MHLKTLDILVKLFLRTFEKQRDYARYQLIILSRGALVAVFFLLDQLLNIRHSINTGRVGIEISG